jgi:hypothetical protein
MISDDADNVLAIQKEYVLFLLIKAEALVHLVAADFGKIIAVETLEHAVDQGFSRFRRSPDRPGASGGKFRVGFG